jgi:hypothetical protein
MINGRNCVCLLSRTAAQYDEMAGREILVNRNHDLGIVHGGRLGKKNVGCTRQGDLLIKPSRQSLFHVSDHVFVHSQ